MFPANYFAPHYFALRYFPKIGGSVLTPETAIDGANYYAGHYFPAHYFAPHYFPSQAVSATYYNGLVEALAAFLAADGAITGAFTGGWTDGPTDRDTAMPYGVFQEMDTQRKNSFKAGYCVEKVTINFYVVAPSAETAKANARVLKKRLLANGTYVPNQFLLNDGREITRFATGEESTIQDPERGPFNTDVWTTTVPIVWKLARGGES